MADEPGLPGAELLYEWAPCALMLADSKGLLLHVNGRLCSWLQYGREELVGQRRFQDLLTMGGRIFHQTHLAPLLRMQGSVAEVKLELVRKDGRAVPVMVNAAEHAHEGRILLHVAAFVAEDRHKYEQELLLQRRRAEELLALHEQDQRELGAARAQAEDRALFAEQMVGIVSHDLRNPLSAIHMSAALLVALGPTEQQKTVVGRITRSVGRAHRLINDLLDFTQARLGGGLSVKAVPSNVHDVVGETLAEWVSAFSGREILHRREGPGEAALDTDRIVQAVGNLVANAVNYGAEGQPVTITTRGVGQGAEICVHNHGEPIPAQVLPHLFEPMIRGEKSAGSRGVGLGLYIVRAIAQAHGGEASAVSLPGAGTTFTISLPASSAGTAHPAPPAG
jgi:sigma-B regulation protein RsbU (phosphoserine phosphatase)